MLKKIINQAILQACQRLYQRFQKAYHIRFNKPLPTILVAGNIGKSSQTLLLKNLFENAGYTVWTGAGKNKNYNTINGLTLALTKNKNSINDTKTSSKIKFVLYTFLKSFFYKWEFQDPKQILIYEVGVDHQGEMQNYTKIFKSVDWVVLSSFGPEHTAGFDHDLNSQLLAKTKDNLKELDELLPAFLKELNTQSPTLQNCYLEQLSLTSIAQNFCLPANLNFEGENHVIASQKPRQKSLNQDIKIHKPKIERDLQTGTLIVNKLKTSSDYLLPKTFSRQIQMIQILAQNFEIEANVIQKTIQNIQLPNGRFSRLKGQNNSTIIDGSYNSDPLSLSAFLDLMLEAQPRDSDSYLILGEMRELGDEATKLHSQILQKISKIQSGFKKSGSNLQVDLLGQEWKKCSPTLLSDFRIFNRVAELILRYQKLSKNWGQSKPWLWIKGSQNTIFLEALIESLLENQDRDRSKLTRRGQEWDEIRSEWI